MGLFEDVSFAIRLGRFINFIDYLLGFRMRINEKALRVMRWTVRVLSVGVLLFGLPFYFGYGNPLPFVDSNYTFWDNMWLTVFPLMFIGLGLGLRYERLGGYFVVVPVGVGLVLGFVVAGDFVVHMLVPFVLGVLYLVVGHEGKVLVSKN